MSWAEEDWTVGLSGRVLQKVKELQSLKDRLSRESKQKQLQLDNIHTNLEKQTVKYEEVRGELLSSRRELQMAQNEAKAAVTSMEHLTQELQTKQAQICSYEGQLNAAHTLNNKLTLEIKRLEAELEKLQNSSQSADITLFSTPCWSAASPWEHSGPGSRKEGREHRDEGRSRHRLQFSDGGSPSLPQQQHKNTPHRHPSNQSDSFYTPPSVFPWERDDSRPAVRRQSPPSPQMPCTDADQSMQVFSETRKDYRTETATSSSASPSRVSALEEDLHVKNEQLKSIQKEMAQSKKDLAAKDLSIQRAQNDLSLAHTCIDQESERASTAEQRVKQLQEELRCQRQNAESSRLQHLQRSKELEKQHQRDLAELQKERQSLEKQHQQEVNKLNQELQQARILHNTLQAQTDKLSLQKQQLEKDLDSLKEKLKWTEGQLQDSQKKEAQTQAKLTEATREAERVAVCLEQSRKKESALEEEGKRLAEELADALRLVRELQEQLAATPALLNPIPFYPVGQSITPQPSYSFTPRTSTHIKSTAAVLSGQKREENLDKRKVTSYPSEREPGEGIDSEHIAVVSSDSERSQMGGHRRKVKEENEIKNDTSVTNSTFDQKLSTSCHSDDSLTNISAEGDRGTLLLSADKEPSLKSEQAKTFEDLRGENDALRSELRDAREELQKRLDDLEAQRRAEAEARTRLKQLSRKRATQSVEKEEQEKEWRTQLEKEKAETERLRRALAGLETELKKGREEREKNDRKEVEEQKTKMLEDRENEMIELNFQLKKQLAEVKAQLALEREERKREEEEKNLITNTENDVKKEMRIKLQELEAELELLKSNRKDSPEEVKLSLASSPLAYLALNSNMSLLPSPEQHLLLCESSNQLNMLVSQKTALIQKGVVIEPELPPDMASDHEDGTENCQVGFSLSEKELSDVWKDEPASSDMKKELKRLQKESVKEAKRANQYQVKLEALQSQVILQTQQLTQAFEKQSQHISGLLSELQAKESALLSQGEALQHYKQELDALKDQRDKDGKKRREEMTVKEEENVQKERLVVTAAGDSAAQRDAGQASDSEGSTHTFDDEELCSGKRHPDSVDSDRIQTQRGRKETVCRQDSEDRSDVAELQSLRQENQLLKRRLLDSTASNITAPVLHTDNEHPEDAAVQREKDKIGTVHLPCLAEPRAPCADAHHSPLQHEKRSGGGGLEREDGSAEEEHRAASFQIRRLQQQVVELQMKIQVLSEETEQQAVELALWRLASGPAPTFDVPNTNSRSESRNQWQNDETSRILPRKQSQVQKPGLGDKENSGSVTIIREDELLLSCSSNKLQGHMLFSRLQQSNLPDSKSLHPSKKTPAPQKNNQDPSSVDKDSEKENQEINSSRPSKTCQTHLKQKRDAEVIQTSPEKTCQQDSHNALGTKQANASRCHVWNPEARPHASRQINVPSGRDVRTEMRSVSSQTEDSLCPGGAPQDSVHSHCASTQTEEVDSPPASSLPPSEEEELQDAVLFSGAFPIPADPVRLAERIRRNRTQLSAAFDDTEYEPYGLPEVVMKGFADIPSGPSCPYIVRRGLLGTAVLPVPQKDQEQEETD